MIRLRGPLIKLFRSLWLIGSCLILISGGIVVLKVYEETTRTQERGRLVSSIVDQQFHEVSGNPSRNEVQFSTLESWPDDSLALKRWTIQQGLSLSDDPLSVLHKLDTLRRAHPHSQIMEVSLMRWRGTLQRWAEEVREKKSSPWLLMDEARQRSFEAAGYKRIGRSYDSTILHLWTISLLTRFIRKQPFDEQVPEALFMLGVAYLNLGRALPPPVRGDRILNLCSELYPDSFWANRSSGVWREAASDEI